MDLAETERSRAKLLPKFIFINSLWVKINERCVRVWCFTKSGENAVAIRLPQSNLRWNRKNSVREVRRNRDRTWTTCTITYREYSSALTNPRSFIPRRPDGLGNIAPSCSPVVCTSIRLRSWSLWWKQVGDADACQLLIANTSRIAAARSVLFLDAGISALAQLR